MFVSLKVVVLHPKLNGVEEDRNHDHHEDQLHVRVAFQPQWLKNPKAHLQDYFVKRNLLEEHNDFGEEHAWCPYENLE